MVKKARRRARGTKNALALHENDGESSMESAPLEVRERLLGNNVLGVVKEDILELGGEGLEALGVSGEKLPKPRPSRNNPNEVQKTFLAGNQRQSSHKISFKIYLTSFQ